jgi:hypothetical protein
METSNLSHHSVLLTGRRIVCTFGCPSRARSIASWVPATSRARRQVAADA